MNALVTATGLTKKYGRLRAVDNVDFEIPAGRIVGLVGPNGAGKSTILKAILGLTGCTGNLHVLDKIPRRDRVSLMREVSYISDVAALPSWIRVDQLLTVMRNTHPAFDQAKSMEFLSGTDIRMDQKVRQLSKGMKTQLHLALVMGVNARLLILDEPTLGLDIIYRKKFYSQLLNEYFDEDRTILVTTHQIEEIEHILTDVLFINKGRMILDMPIEDVGDQFVQLTVDRHEAEQARMLQPLNEVEQMNKVAMIFRNVDKARLAELGELSTPRLADLFVACIEGAGHD